MLPVSHYRAKSLTRPYAMPHHLRPHLSLPSLHCRQLSSDSIGISCQHSVTNEFLRIDTELEGFAVIERQTFTTSLPICLFQQCIYLIDSTCMVSLYFSLPRRRQP